MAAKIQAKIRRANQTSMTIQLLNETKRKQEYLRILSSRYNNCVLYKKTILKYLKTLNLKMLKKTLKIKLKSNQSKMKLPMWPRSMILRK